MKTHALEEKIAATEASMRTGTSTLPEKRSFGIQLIKGVDVPASQLPEAFFTITFEHHPFKRINLLYTITESGILASDVYTYVYEVMKHIVGKVVLLLLNL